MSKLTNKYRLDVPVAPSSVSEKVDDAATAPPPPAAVGGGGGGV